MELTACMLQLEKRERELIKWVAFDIFASVCLWICYTSQLLNAWIRFLLKSIGLWTYQISYIWLSQVSSPNLTAFCPLNSWCIYPEILLYDMTEKLILLKSRQDWGMGWKNKLWYFPCIFIYHGQSRRSTSVKWMNQNGSDKSIWTWRFFVNMSVSV